jgi:hypothetical protein
MQEARISGASSQYFLGSIVLIKNDREPKSSVIDGQQRLSTLTMLFAALREAMPHAADDITVLYKKGKISLGEKNEYRLIAREEDADFFRTNEYFVGKGKASPFVLTQEVREENDWTPTLRGRVQAALES